MKVVIGSDHGAVELRQTLIAHLEANDITVLDQGCAPGESVHYPDMAAKVCKLVVSKEADKGIVLCGSGIGISIACNKINGIRCALCHDHYTAKMCRNHNDANVIAIGGRVTGPEVAKEMIDTYLEAEFEGGRHATRVGLLSALESN
eukprot:TRINITY_DN20315_c0_g1_i2.p2 TRINITY_DN20315_c0_g1~~TRINITY_DN20315_c0_g1_i2.p2  ORF type:complete len:147 (+),score=27.84 TRINITY_DN20315_c0_g1_i2:18-458(+)